MATADLTVIRAGPHLGERQRVHSRDATPVAGAGQGALQAARDGHRAGRRAGSDARRQGALGRTAAEFTSRSHASGCAVIALQRAVRSACVDIGSNTTRLLVAEIDGDCVWREMMTQRAHTLIGK